MELVGMTLWGLFLVLTIAASSLLIVLFKPKNLRPAFFLGLFLAFFDFAVENLGALNNLWYATGSFLAIGAVPVEVFCIAILAGGVYRLVMPCKQTLGFAAATSLLIAVVGVTLEAMLIEERFLTYAGGWTTWHALAAYFVTFLIMGYVNSLTGNTAEAKKKVKKNA